MSRDFYHSNFEDLIRDNADQYKMYPSDKVWKGIDRSLRSRRKWYWMGFALLLSGISYVAIVELITPSTPVTSISAPPTRAVKPQVQTRDLRPFPSAILPEILQPPSTAPRQQHSSLVNPDGGSEFFEDVTIAPTTTDDAALPLAQLRSLRISEKYYIDIAGPQNARESIGMLVTPEPGSPQKELALESVEAQRINWLQEQASFRMSPRIIKRISWQLAFSPTINYRKLTGGGNTMEPSSTEIPFAPQAEGKIENLVNHRPALGFELGTHALLSLSKRLTVKGGIQFNYSKYDIEAFRSDAEFATIALNSSLVGLPNSITSYTDLRNFGGSKVENLKNQYFHLSAPIGLEFRVFGNDRLQFNVASTIQPTYVINGNAYLITTNYRNYTKEPSLVRKWNVNAGAEAFIAYNRGGVKWQVGPQFRYQLLSSYDKAYPIKEYLMEYGIKVGVTKTIR